MNQTILIGLVSLLASPLFAQQATSPDGKWVVFVKPGHGPAIETGSGPTEPKELWQRDPQGHTELMLRTHDAKDPKDIVAGFEGLQFSSDGKLVYFITPNYATGGCVHVLDTTNKHEHFVTSGELVNILSTDDGDRLLVTSRCYDQIPKGGSVYWDYFIVTPEGQELKKLGMPFHP